MTITDTLLDRAVQMLDRLDAWVTRVEARLSALDDRVTAWIGLASCRHCGASKVLFVSHYRTEDVDTYEAWCEHHMPVDTPVLPLALTPVLATWPEIDAVIAAAAADEWGVRS